MAYIEVDIEIEDHLDEVSTAALVEELKSRKDNPFRPKEEQFELALWEAQRGNINEAMLQIERALPQFKGLLWR